MENKKEVLELQIELEKVKLARELIKLINNLVKKGK